MQLSQITPITYLIQFHPNGKNRFSLRDCWQFYFTHILPSQNLEPNCIAFLNFKNFNMYKGVNLRLLCVVSSLTLALCNMVVVVVVCTSRTILVWPTAGEENEISGQSPKTINPVVHVHWEKYLDLLENYISWHFKGRNPDGHGCHLLHAIEQREISLILISDIGTQFMEWKFLPCSW